MRVRLTVTRRMYRPVALRPLWRTQEAASSASRCCWPAAAWARAGHQAPGHAHRHPRLRRAASCARCRSRTARRSAALLRGAAAAARASSTASRPTTTPRSTAATACGPTSAPACARTPAVVGSFPEPFLHGIDGKRLPVRIECADARGARLPAGRRPAGRPTRSRPRAAGCRPRGRRRPCACSSAPGPRCASIRPPTRSSTGRAPAASTRGWRPTGGRSRCSTRAGAPRARSAPAAAWWPPPSAPTSGPPWVVTGTDAAGVGVGRAGLRGGHARPPLRARGQPRPARRAAGAGR